MTEPKFTPGPWTLPHFARPDVNCQCEYVLCDHLMGAVASVHCSGDGDDWAKSGDNPKFQEAVANAHLIAAAPQMYEALKAAMAFINSHVADPDITPEMASNWATLMGTQPNEVLSAAVGEAA